MVFFPVNPDFIGINCYMNNNLIVGEKLAALQVTSPALKTDLEAWVVNSVKVKMLEKYSRHFETDGVKNLRELFLAPIFEIPELADRVNGQGVELRTLFYKELMECLAEIENKIP